MSDLVEDWNKLINDKIDTNEFVRTHWDKFIYTFIKVMRKRDDSELYIKLHSFIEKMLKLDIVPVFEYPSQIIQYFKNCLIHDNINELRTKKLITVSLDCLKEEHNIELENTDNSCEQEYELNSMLCEIEKRVSPLLMTSIILAIKGYSRKEISELLGINLHTINDRFFRSKEIIYDILKNQY